jgi:hypothetical protein
LQCQRAEQCDEVIGGLKIHSLRDFNLDSLSVDRTLASEPAIRANVRHERECPPLPRPHR